MRRKPFGIAQSAVEFALVVPLLLLVLFGILEMGRLTFLYVAVLNASREAARYGSANGMVGAIHQYADCAGIEAAATRVGFIANIQDENVSISYDQGPTTTPSTDCESGGTPAGGFRLGSRVLVTVAVDYVPLVPLIPLTSFPITSTSARTLLTDVNINALLTPDPSFDYVEPPSIPTIDSVTPAFGKVAGGDTVTITGTDLIGGAVFFGETGAGCTVDSATQITCTTPAHAAGTVSVVVTTAIGSATAPDAFTFVPPPVISSLSPDSGPATGGTSVILIGENFLDTASVTFGGKSTSFHVDSATQITCDSPLWLAAAGDVPVVVTTPGGESNSEFFTYIQTPTISQLTPTSGLTTGGYTVTIVGNNLDDDGTVNFDGADCSDATLGDTQIICTTKTVPVHPVGSVDVFFTVEDMTSNTVSFSYKPPAPTIDIISPDPAEGLTTGGTIVKITGHYLTYETIAGTTVKGTVTFDGADCNVDSDELITCTTKTTPVHAAGSVTVFVTTPGGSSNLESFKFFPPPPVISGVLPLSGLTTGNETVSITGNYLTGATLINFTIDGLAATGCAVISDTQITCTTPPHPAPGTFTGSISVTTPGGTSSPYPLNFTYRLPPPIVTNISPLFGKTDGGEPVTITGIYLTGATLIDFTIDGLAATGCAVKSDTQITCTTPPHPTPGTFTGSITVTTPGGTYGPHPLSFKYYGKPVITSLTPNYGKKSTAITVIITGTNLAGVTSVSFVGTSATAVVTSMVMNPDGTITCYTPGSFGTGTVSVTVTTLGGTSNSLPFYFTANGNAP